MTKWLRLAVAILLIWLLGGVLSWSIFDPGDSLVGARSGHAPPVPAYNLAPNDLRELSEVLSKTRIWGIQHDGAPLPPPKPRDAEEKKVDWRILAAIRTNKDRYIVIRIDKGDPVVIKEGEQLPDGSKLLKAAPNLLILRTADGKQQKQILNFD